MAKKKYKQFSDPVHGFITVPDTLLRFVKTPEMQRLRRIRQLGMGPLIFPGAEHTRFSHALGALALMQDALRTLTEKGTPISAEEHNAALAAALLHDIGHGPFSHTLEFKLIKGFSHEAIGHAVIMELNKRFNGALDLTLSILDGSYERPFFHSLIASQLDMDRLDYLRRDSHFTGVIEGRVGAGRVIQTMRVHPTAGGSDSQLVIETKGIYAVENVLMARRLMYWQVYVHKTVVAADNVLLAAIRRARFLLQTGNTKAVKGIPPAFHYFLAQELEPSTINNPDILQAFMAIDDTDVLYSLKRWNRSTDPILADLSRRLIERNLFRCVFLSHAPSAEEQAVWTRRMVKTMLSMGLTNPAHAEADAAYYLTVGNSRHSAYEKKDVEKRIHIQDSRGDIHELSASGDTSSPEALAYFAQKPYVCFLKDADILGESG